MVLQSSRLLLANGKHPHLQVPKSLSSVPSLEMTSNLLFITAVSFLGVYVTRDYDNPSVKEQS